MNSSILTITAVLLLICLLWMDACLYFQIQCFGNEDQVSPNSSSQVHQSDRKQQEQYSNKTNSPISFMNKFSYAFQGMSIKLMMTDPVDNYLLAPLSEALVETLNFKENFLFITPNMVSYAGVISALIAAQLVSYDSSIMHKLSVVMFQLRTWLDDLDGDVARSRLGIHTHVSLQKTPGYIIDGVCDGIGFVAYIIGCYIYMRNNIKRRKRSRTANRYNLQSITEIKSSSSSTYIPLQQDCNETECLPHGGLHAESRINSDRGFNLIEGGDDDEEEEEDDEDVHFSAVADFNYRKNCSSSDTLVTKESQGFRKSQNFFRSRIYLEKIQNGKQSTIIFYKYIKEKIKNKLSNRKLFLVTLLFLLQIAMCATFWNRYILVYRDLLESPSVDQTQARMKSKILKSNIFYIIVWFWRLTNGHSLMQMLIAAVFIGKLWQFLDFIKYIGFIEIIILATITELHVTDIKNYLN